MSTRRYNFASLVKCGQMRLADNKMLPPQTQITPLGRGVVGNRLLQNLLTDLEVSVAVVKVSYVVLSSVLIPLLGLLNDALWFTKRV